MAGNPSFQLRSAPLGAADLEARELTPLLSGAGFTAWKAGTGGASGDSGGDGSTPACHHITSTISVILILPLLNGGSKDI